MVVHAIRYGANTLNQYDLHAFVVMPNHVHLLCTPMVPLPHLTRSLKGITARRANAILGSTGKPFWQEESYDHLVRNSREFDKIKRYIEYNSVKAGLVSAPTEYRWSSATGPAWAPAPDVGVRPTAARQV
jgi:REP element-mobilizing transposase RayT